MDANIELIYEAVVTECRGLDAIYEDYIIHLVGCVGLRVLLDRKLLETCGVINGRQLYTLVND